MGGVAAPGGEGSLWRHNVARAGVGDQEGDGLAGAIGQGGCAGADVIVSAGIDDGTVTRGIAVQVGIDTALHGGKRSGLIGINGSDLPVADYVFQYPIAILERTPIVEHL